MPEMAPMLRQSDSCHGGFSLFSLFRAGLNFCAMSKGWAGSCAPGPLIEERRRSLESPCPMDVFLVCSLNANRLERAGPGKDGV